MALLLAALAAAGAAAWFFAGEHATSQTPPSGRQMAAPPARAPATPLANRATLPPPTPVSTRPEGSLSATPVSQPPPVEPERSFADLERRYRGAVSTETRADLARQIAGANNAEAVLALGRLFKTERHPTAKAAVLEALADVDADVAPEARIATLTAALHGQARDIRISALGSLAELDDPRALALLRQTGARDPDKFVREAAAELYKSRMEDESR